MTSRNLFVDGWRFLKLPLESTYDEAKNKINDFEKVKLPHDWLIYNVSALYEDGKGFYLKTFSLYKDAKKKYEIYFEGVYMDTIVYVNDIKIGEWKYGYSSFYFDMTDALRDGENTIAVEICHQSPNTRWYSGAGIFRDVYFIEKDASGFATDGIYISSKKVNDFMWNTKCIAECEGEIKDTDEQRIEIIDADGDIVFSKQDKVIVKDNTIETDISVTDPELWSIDSPYLYTCRQSWIRAGEIVDSCETTIGYKELVFDLEEGLFLNGEHVKLNGVCEHHDFGALGAAFNKNALRRKFEVLKTMGVNAIRSTHNMPAVALMDLADEMGFLVIDEAFDMWEWPKTKFDYARFFKEWYKADVRSWVRRDRNHVCLLMWSIGNEIYDTHEGPRGQEVTRLLKDEVEKYDYLGNAHATIGSNYMTWENAQKCAEILKFAGYNYTERLYADHHEKHPDWIIYGSETASTVQSRGIYHFPLKQAVLADDDEQCSAIGNSTTSWGADNPEYCITADRDAKFSLGQFIWTGFDYIGEPTPYHTKNSYFGQIDTAGFPKDSYYLYRSHWNKKDDTLHIFPYWSWNENQQIDVRVATNASIVELFLNGRSLGVKEINHESGRVMTADYVVPYEEGELVAVSYDENRNIIGKTSRHSFSDAVSLRAKAYKERITFEREALAYIEIETLDENGYVVENANNRVFAKVKNGYILGMDNGDSTDEDEYKTDNKRLFSGKLLLIVAPDGKGDIEVELTSNGLTGTSVVVPVDNIPSEASDICEADKISDKVSEDDIWVREIKIISMDGVCFNKEVDEIDVCAKIFPKEALKYVKPEDIIWKAVNDSGIESSLAEITPNGFNCHLKAMGDGDFRLRCMVKNGKKQVNVISSLEFTAKDIGVAYLNPYNFIAGGLYTYSEGNLGNGNEHGVSSAREERSVIGFEKIDFGAFGSDEITVPIFELSSEPTPLQIWEGIPNKEGSVLLTDVVYHKPCIWNEYQAETYKLSKRVKGISSIHFVFNQKVHLKGFSFTKQEKAFEKLYAAECDGVYGDEFTKKDKEIVDIGNNVSIEFNDMNFGEEGVTSITISGKTTKTNNSIHVLFEGDVNRREILEFTGSDKKEMTFNIEKVTGKNKVTFVFLPGSQFDFESFKFNK